MPDTDSSTISKDQFKRLTESVLKEAPKILKDRDPKDKAMDKKSALLRALYLALQEKLGSKPVKTGLPTRGFKTYEFAYREAIYELALEHATEPFEYVPIVDSYLSRAMRQ
jgi:aminopeptidase C